MIQVGVLALSGCLASAVYGVIEILVLANSLAESELFTTRVFTVDGDPVASYTGSTIASEGSLDDAQPDIMILPPLMDSLGEALNMKKIVEWLADHHGSGGQVATVCAGSFLLAETGMLDGREATTHWNLADMFRRRYPAVNLQVQRLLVDCGDYICCGGVSAWMDLALYLVTRYAGREVSRTCAKILLMDPHREHQTPYGMGGFQKNHNDTAILKAQTVIEEKYKTSIVIGEIASEVGLGERTFQRRFRLATGTSPSLYVQQVRMEAAQVLLETTDMSVESVAEKVGYNDYSAFRKLFKRIMGNTPSAYRQRFGVRGRQLQER
ncbi:GlxA family transcriptional regulator [Desulfopila sp. IMCC35008]|uniref:GlxA family transcriptional regulator n=1 Tax=Desulfopila sp. IMCC35008 TaxID=2653858 RepID=UPI0013D3D344|nr:GlxA family transcriptional regulator [Desulfopila sp. IMCC35008]